MKLLCKLGLHQWASDCSKCSNCGKTREVCHSWKGCCCSNCARTINSGHQFENGICKMCKRSETDTLSASYHTGYWRDRREAVQRLGELGGPIELLIKALADCDTEVNKPAASALLKLGADKIIDPLIKALSARSYKVYDEIGSGSCNQVPSAAAKFLGDLGDPRAIEPLKKFISDLSEHLNHRVASDALLKLNALEPKSKNKLPTSSQACDEEQNTKIEGSLVSLNKDQAALELKKYWDAISNKAETLRIKNQFASMGSLGISLLKEVALDASLKLEARKCALAVGSQLGGKDFGMFIANHFLIGKNFRDLDYAYSRGDSKAGDQAALFIEAKSQVQKLGLKII